MPASISPQVTTTESTDPRWRNLYRLGGIASILSELIILLGILAFILWPYTPGYTSTASIFAFIQDDPLGGLLSLDLLLFLGNLVGILTFLALYASLKPVNESYALVALALGLIAAAMIIPARPMVEIFYLSKMHLAATSDAERSQYLAAGEALLALFNGIAKMTNNFLGAVSLLISALLMLRSRFFSRATAYVGIVTNTVVLGFFLPAVGPILLFLSLAGYLVWNIQLALSFFRLWRQAAPFSH